MKTFDELVSQYMLCEKKTLAEMMALRDLYKGDDSTSNHILSQPYPPYQPWCPITCPSKKDEEEWGGYKIWANVDNNNCTISGKIIPN